MTAVSTIERAIASGLLNLFRWAFVSETGATDAEIAAEESLLPRPFSLQHKAILKRWNGIDLGAIKFYGCAATPNRIGRISTFQGAFRGAAGVPVGAVVVAASVAGLLYIEAADGQVLSWDSDGGEVASIAADIDSFMSNYLFGPGASQFGGSKWVNELRSVGLAPD